MKKHLLALAAAALLSGTAAVSAQGLSQDQSQSPKSQTKDQIARPDAQPGMGEDQKGSAAGGEQATQPGSKSDQNMRRTQVQGGEQREQVQGRERGPQGGEMLRGGEMRGASHTLTVEQKTRLRETVFRAGPRLTNINFRIGVGVHIPRSVRVVAVPEEIVAIYPEWASDLYFVYGDEIVIVAPGTFEIVGVLPL